MKGISENGRLGNLPWDDVAVAIRIAASLSPPPAIPEEARRSFAEGLAAFELARSPSDYEEPKKRFAMAASLAPWWRDALFNLSLAEEKLRRFRDAKKCLESCLLATPGSRDADDVRQRLHRIEYLAERQREAEGRIARGSELFRAGKYREAAEEDMEGVRLDPDSFRPESERFICGSFGITRRTARPGRRLNTSST